MIFEGLEVTPDGFRLAITSGAWDDSKRNTFDVEPEHFDVGRYVQFVESRVANDEHGHSGLIPAHWYVADATGQQVG